MSLLNTLKAIKEEGFDPKKDSINSGGGLLDTGKYPVVLSQSELGATKAGHEQIIITLEVVSGEHKGRKEMIFLAFYDELPDFVKEKNGKILLSVAEFANVTFTNKDLADEFSTAEALRAGIGQQFNIDLKIVPNKNNPDYPYRNYDFSSLNAELDVNDEELLDLPF